MFPINTSDGKRRKSLRRDRHARGIVNGGYWKIIECIELSSLAQRSQLLSAS